MVFANLGEDDFVNELGVVDPFVLNHRRPQSDLEGEV